MNVKRFFAASTREALRALKAELGADAIVLSNRAVAGGVEILALPPEAVESLHAAQPARAVQPARPDARPDAGFSDYGDDFHVTLSSLAAGAVPRHLADRAPRQPAPTVRASSVRPPSVRPFTPPRLDAEAPERARPAKSGERSESREPMRALQETNARLMEELAGIRGVIERELAGFSWHETQRRAPARAAMLGQLLAAGFSAGLARELAGAVAEEATPEAARDSLGAALEARLKPRAGGREIIDELGIYALIGPTGVGKTTTVAKLAARFVTRHGAGRLALITTDGYRIGAQEQLRIYGRILGVPVFAVRDASELRQTLLDLRDKEMVLIDTMGMSQRDRTVVTQAAMLAGAGEVRRLLLLNATCRGDTLDDVVRAFAGPEKKGGGETAGCILTKVDEAVSLAPALDVAMRRKLDVCYVTNGQRVPEDLHLPNRAYLLHRALRAQADESRWRLDGDEAGAMLGAQGA